METEEYFMANTTESKYESIYENICRSRDELDMLPKGYSLPLEASSQGDKYRFADGALDGMAIYHMGIPPQDASLLEQALDAAVSDLEQAHRLINAWVVDGHMISVMNQVQQYVSGHQERLPPSQIYRLAVECALKGTHREEVKFGIVLLGLIETDQNEQLKHALRILALSDEFTLYVLQLASQWTFPDKEILRIAKKVHGWGRIHAVTWLRPTSREIEDWLFAEGWDNTILPAYSALECCRKVNLQGRLEDSLNERDYSCACGLLAALLDERPVPGISEVEDCAGLLNAFVNCSASRAVSPQRQKTLELAAEYAAAHELPEIAERIRFLL